MPRKVMAYDELPEHIRRLNPQADPADRAAGRRCPEPERGQLRTLDRSAPAPALVDGLPRPCVVRITRVGTRRYDDDNLVGGCKELRDAVAAALGLPGDAEEDGGGFEYHQETDVSTCLDDAWLGVGHRRACLGGAVTDSKSILPSYFPFRHGWLPSREPSVAGRG